MALRSRSTYLASNSTICTTGPAVRGASGHGWWVLACLLSTVLTLTGCTGGEVQAAVGHCSAEISSRYGDQMAEVDPDEMLRDALVLSDGTVSVASAITFRAGTSSEHSQRYVCQVALRDPSGRYQPRVIGLQIDPIATRKQPLRTG